MQAEEESAKGYKDAEEESREERFIETVFSELIH